MKKILFLICLILSVMLISCGSAPSENGAVPSYEVACYTVAQKGFADITAPLPDGWEYSVITETDEIGGEIFGIRFCPTAHPELSVRIGWRPGRTIPDNTGAGVRTKIPLSDGSILWHHSKRQGDDAQSIVASWSDYPFLYLAEYTLPDALEAEYEPIIREILSFTEFGGMRSATEAVDMVAAKFESYHSACYTEPLPDTGAWCVSVQETEGAAPRYFHVAHDGVIREYFSEDQPMGGSEIVFRDDSVIP